MKSHQLHSNVRSAIAVATPGMTFPQKCLVRTAGVLLFGFLAFRKFRLLRKKENLVPYALGSALDAVTKRSPTLQQVARFPFGSISILRCSEDLAEIGRLVRLSGRLILGKEYMVVKKDTFLTVAKPGLSPSLQDKMRWWNVVVRLQIKQLFKTIGEIFKRLFELAMHLGDAYTAFKENNVAEVFIHSRDLWNELTSQDSKIVKYLKRTEQINDWMLGRLGSSKTTGFLIKMLQTSANLRAAVPEIGNGIKTTAQNEYSRIEATIEDQITHDYDALGGDRNDLQDQQKYYAYDLGSKDDPNEMRFIDPPRMDPTLLKMK